MLRFSLVFLALLAFALPASAQFATSPTQVSAPITVNYWVPDFVEISHVTPGVGNLPGTLSIKVFWQGCYKGPVTVTARVLRGTTWYDSTYTVPDSVVAVPNSGKWKTDTGLAAVAVLSGLVIQKDVSIAAVMSEAIRLKAYDFLAVPDSLRQGSSVVRFP